MLGVHQDYTAIQGQRYLELRGDRREIPFAKDYSHGRSSGRAITLRIGIFFFPKVWLTLAQ